MNRLTEAANTVACELVGETVRKFGEVRFRVFGTSMVPAIGPGDLVWVERASMAEVSPGEIVVFARKGRLTVHRLMVKSDSQGDPLLVTRGDRMWRDDALVSGPELIGRVTQIERNHSGIPAPPRLNLTQQVICRLLRYSDRATSLYLHIASRWHECFPMRTA
jgi:signal peptidase I